MNRCLPALVGLVLLAAAPAFANLTDTSHIHLRGRITTDAAKEDPNSKTFPAPSAGIEGVHVSARLLSHQTCLLDRRIGDVFVDAASAAYRSTGNGTTIADGTWEIVMSFPRAYSGNNGLGVQTPEWLDCLRFMNSATASDFELSATKPGYSFRRR